MTRTLQFSNETEWFAEDLRAAFAAFTEGTLGAPAMKVTPGSGLTVDVAAGNALIANDDAAYTGDNFLVRVLVAQSSEAFGGISAAHATLPRVDRIVGRITGAPDEGTGSFSLTIVTGTATAGADLTTLNGAGAVPANSILLANVLIGATATSLTVAEISDKRVSAYPSSGGGGGGGAAAVDTFATLEAITGADGEIRGVIDEETYYVYWIAEGFWQPLVYIGLQLTTNEKNALDAANAPTTLNPFATMADAGIPARFYADHTTASLAANATENFERSTPGITAGTLLDVLAGNHCWVRIYATMADRTADAGRTLGAAPADNAGLIFDHEFTAPEASTTIRLTPPIGWFNGDLGEELVVSLKNLEAFSAPILFAANFTPTEGP